MDKTALLRELAVELTTLRGEIIRAENTDYWAVNLIFPNGDRIGCHLEDGRCRFWAASPLGCTCNIGSAPEIHANSTRTPAAIAQDINRRLFPDARQHWVKCRTAQTQHEDRITAIHASLDRLSPYLTGHRLSNEGEEADIYTNALRARLYSSTTGEIHQVEIHHLTIEQFIQVMKIIEEAPQ